MTEQKNNMTGLVIFERPIQIANNSIYGIVYNKRTEQRNTENGNNLADYVSYLVGCEKFLKNGGTISDDGKLWSYPDGVHELMCNHSLFRLLELLMRDIVKIKTIEFDQPIEWNEGEVDEDGSPCLILDRALIERYTNEQAEK